MFLSWIFRISTFCMPYHGLLYYMDVSLYLTSYRLSKKSSGGYCRDWRQVTNVNMTHSHLFSCISTSAFSFDMRFSALERQWNMLTYHWISRPVVTGKLPYYCLENYTIIPCSDVFAGIDYHFHDQTRLKLFLLVICLFRCEYLPMTKALFI